MLQVYQFPCLKDNYGYIIIDEASKRVATIDSPDAEAIIDKAKSLNIKIDEVWNTHWHPDHAGGNAKLKQEFGAQIFAPNEVKSHGFIADTIIEPGQSISLGNSKAEIIDVSGHTMGHIAFSFKEQKKIFLGDALFALGCGRIFEGTPEQTYNSLLRLMDLDDETLVYCAHEYSLANAIFCESLGLSNDKLKNRVSQIKQMREDGKPTIPTTIGIEKATSPFLLADYENLVKELGLLGKSKLEVFATIRKMKDDF